MFIIISVWVVKMMICFQLDEVSVILHIKNSAMCYLESNTNKKMDYPYLYIICVKMNV